MNEEIARKAMTAIEKMAHVMSNQQKEHFASILTILTNCYGENAKWRGALLLADGEQFISVGINANEFEIAGLVSEASVILNTEIKAEAPEHGMYN
jgi:hypothetical protein